MREHIEKALLNISEGNDVDVEVDTLVEMGFQPAGHSKKLAPSFWSDVIGTAVRLQRKPMYKWSEASLDEKLKRLAKEYQMSPKHMKEFFSKHSLLTKLEVETLTNKDAEKLENA